MGMTMTTLPDGRLYPVDNTTPFALWHARTAASLDRLVAVFAKATKAGHNALGVSTERAALPPLPCCTSSRGNWSVHRA